MFEKKYGEMIFNAKLKGLNNSLQNQVTQLNYRSTLNYNNNEHKLKVHRNYNVNIKT